LLLTNNELEMGQKFLIFTLFIFAMCQAELNAQSAVSASGSVALGSGGSVSYTVGQIAYSFYSDKAYSVTQGVQQPYEISITTSLGGANAITLTCEAYPNPVKTDLTLYIENYINENISYSLIDEVGKLVDFGKINLKRTIIPMDKYVEATYYLKVEQAADKSSPKKTKVFKIIKNKRR
jgi:hypothetical protein